jgi:hypothetical protein
LKQAPSLNALLGAGTAEKTSALETCRFVEAMFDVVYLLLKKRHKAQAPLFFGKFVQLKTGLSPKYHHPNYVSSHYFHAGRRRH